MSRSRIALIAVVWTALASLGLGASGRSAPFAATQEAVPSTTREPSGASEVLRFTLRRMPDADLVRDLEQALARAAASGIRHALLELALPAEVASAVDALVLERLRSALDPQREVQVGVLATWPGQGPAAALLCAVLPEVHALEGCESFRPVPGAAFGDGAAIERLLVGLGIADAASRARALARLGDAAAAPLGASEVRALGWITSVVPDRESFLAQRFALAPPIVLREAGALAAMVTPEDDVARAAAAAPTSAGAESRVLRIPIRETVDDAMVGQVVRGLERARSEGFTLVVIDIDTPGGAVVSMWAIAEAIGAYKAEGRRAVAYVSNHAISAGMVIALSCATIWMRENSSIGAATPVMAGPSGIEAPGDGGRSDSAEKVMSFFRADVRKLAQKVRADRPNAVLLAEGMVDRSIALVAFETRTGEVFIYPRDEFERLRKEGRVGEREGKILEEWGDQTLVTLTHAEAARYGFADGVVSGFEEVLAREQLVGARVEELPMTWSEELVRALSAWSFILFLAACVFAYVEFKVPGFGVPGIASIALFSLLFFGKYLGGIAELQEILLFFAGLALIAVEIFVLPGTFFFGAAGAICAILGLFLSFHGFALPSNEFEVETVFSSVGAFLAALTGTVLFSLAFGRYFPNLPFFGRLVSVPTGAEAAGWNSADLEGPSPWLGRRGRATTDLRPAGKVRIDGQVLDVLTEGEFVPSGTEVEVVRAKGRHLTVSAARPSRS
jgi:membrane-bound serine protease (ClpP class)